MASTRWSEDLIPVEAAQTLDGLFRQRVRRSPERVACRAYDRRAQAWQALTWRDMAVQAARWGSALAGEPGLRRGDRVAVLLRNCPEWVIFDQAGLSLGLVIVPLYTDDRPDNAAYVLQDAAVKVLLVQDAGRWKRLAAAIGDAPCPRRVVILEAGDEAQRVAAGDARAVTAGDWLPPAATAPGLPQAGPDDLASIVYTSGTTGRPKGQTRGSDPAIPGPNRGHVQRGSLTCGLARR